MMERFSRQYFLVKEKENLNIGNDWQQVHFHNYDLFVHGDMPCYSEIREGHTVVLLGYVFHIEKPEWEEQKILKTLSTTEPELFEQLDYLAGNYIIFIEDEKGLHIVNDNAAVLKAFYFLKEGHVQAIASDPLLLAEIAPIQKDDSVEANAFYSSSIFKKKVTRVGDKTSFKDVFQLLPNHILRATEGLSERFFPREPLEHIPVEESIRKVDRYMANIIKAAANRYNLRCGLSSGFDSRVALMAAREVKDQIKFYTFIPAGNNPNEPDFTIPQQFADRFDLDFELIPLGNEPIENEAVETSYELYQPARFNHIMRCFSRFDRLKDATIIGTVSEITKNYYEDVDIRDGKSLAKASHYPLVPYVVDYLGGKFQELKSLENKFGYDLRDLAHWEQDITNFAGQGSFYSLSMVICIPIFNNRMITKLMLGVPRKMRDKHRHEYYHKMWQTKWPELDEYPVNPDRKHKMMVLAKKLGIYKLYKQISTNLRK